MNPDPSPEGALARHADRTLSDQLAGRFAERIRQRVMSPGARLPSVRDCARRHAVSPSTVVSAYDQLLAQGLVEARRQRGFFVRGDGADAPRAPQAGPASRTPLPVNATSLIRAMFQPPGSLPAPALGTLPADWLDLPMLAAAMRKAASGTGLAEASLRYGEPAGELRLRQSLSRRLADFGIGAAPEQIVTTVGATHALDVVTRAVCKPGDAVLVDEPGWSVEYARLVHLGMRVLPVPRGESGPDLAAMRALIEAQPAANRPRLYVTVSVLHNPTGASLTLPVAHRLLQLAQSHDFAIVEDDTYAHLAGTALPRLAALDALERTFYVGGFSKILTPNWRVGYVAAPRGWIDRIVDAKLLSTLTTPALTEIALAHCLDSGALRRHAERVTQRLDAARDRSAKLVLAHGCRFAAPPRGLFGWVDTGVDTERLAPMLLDAGWLIAPGALFHASHRPTSLMRINFATSQEPRFWRALDKARATL